MTNQDEGKKMDWMYKGPQGLVDREEYLLGRTVDKSLQMLDAAERGENFSFAGEVEKDLTPASILSKEAGPSGPVDIIRKIKDDPLYQIQKQEEESLKQLLKNPVKMKRLQQLAASQQKPSKKHKKKKKKKSRSHSSSSSDDDTKDLTAQLFQRLNSLKHKISVSSSSSSEDESSKRSKKSKKAKKSKSRSRSPNRSLTKSSRRSPVHGDRYSSSSSSRLKSDFRRSKEERHDRSRYTERDRFADRHKKSSSNSRNSEEREKELERKRQEMMENAKWRDEQRKARVEKYREEVKKEEQLGKSQSNAEFIKKQLNTAASSGSVEQRIKSNMYNIQRSKGSMHQNFVKR